VTNCELDHRRVSPENKRTKLARVRRRCKACGESSLVTRRGRWGVVIKVLRIVHLARGVDQVSGPKGRNRQVWVSGGRESNPEITEHQKEKGRGCECQTPTQSWNVKTGGGNRGLNSLGIREIASRGISRAIRRKKQAK